MKEKIKQNIPNLFSLLNALCGILAIFISLFYKSEIVIYISCGLILLGGIFDSLDGRIARNFHLTSQIGKELDSFSDLITFGVAPISVFLILNSNVHSRDINIIEIIISAFYILCAIYRLARYNVTDFNGYFSGLPTTASGAILGIYIVISNIFVDKICDSMLYSIISFLIVIMLSFLMVCKFKIKKI